MHESARLICTRITVSGGDEGVGSAVFICLANGGGSGNWFHLFWLIERARDVSVGECSTTLGPGGGGGGEKKSALSARGKRVKRKKKPSARVVYDTRVEC